MIEPTTKITNTTATSIQNPSLRKKWYCRSLPAPEYSHATYKVACLKFGAKGNRSSLASQILGRGNALAWDDGETFEFFTPGVMLSAHSKLKNSMRNWLVGYVVFALMYTIIVGVIFVADWPTLQHPRLYGTLEDKLPENLRSYIRKVESRSPSGDETPFVIRNPANTRQAVSVGATITMINGHVIVLEQDAGEEIVQEIAQQYLDLLENYVGRASNNHIIRLFSVLFMPLLTFIIFGYFARWLWIKLLRLQ